MNKLKEQDMFISYLCAYQNQGKTLWIMTIYLMMLPSSLEHDDTIWRRVDDSWWSFPFAWSFPCSASLTVMSFLLPRLHHSFLILLSCHLSALRSFDTMLDLLRHSLFYACKRLVDDTYPKEYTILKHGLFVYNFVISLYANEKIVLGLF